MPRPETRPPGTRTQRAFSALLSLRFALAISGNTVYAGGDFTEIGGQPRNDIAALDASTGNATSWDPNANSSVYALAVSGSTVYAGGGFTQVGHDNRSHIAALDGSTGNATSWNPNANLNVYDLAVSGSTVYAGGDFTQIGGQPRNHIAALSVSTGNATSWDPNADGAISALVVSGNTVYAGGDFTQIGGQPRNHIAALDASTGNATTWDPDANSSVIALAVSGSTVFAGGLFTGLGGVARSNIAAIDNTTGQAMSWNPGANNVVRALAVSGSTVYAGGDFTQIHSASRNYIAALDVGTGKLLTWNPDANNVVRALAVSGSTVYAGGDFTEIGGQPRSRIAALSSSTGSATTWNPDADNTVRTLVVSNSTVYAGGDFTQIGGSARNRIAAIDASSGTVTPWNPNADWNVYALAVSGSAVYAGGYFTQIGGQPRNHIAALSASTGNATSWDPNAQDGMFLPEILDLAVSSSTVYAGGYFTQIGGQPRNHIAALSASTGNATSWNANPNNTVEALAVLGNTVYVGGDFTSFDLAPQQGFAAFKIEAQLQVQKQGSGQGTVTSSPGGISCGSQCSAQFDQGTQVTLSANPAPGSAFAGWSGGGCSGTGTCQVTLESDQTVTASFVALRTLTVQKQGSGQGTVTSSPQGISCGSTCSAQFAQGTQVTLSANPAPGSAFAGWSGGGCSGTGTCQVTLNSDQTVSASFVPARTLQVQKQGSGQGTVTSSPGGINCGSQCSAQFADGTQVTLTANPAPGSAFAGWSGGGCSGTGSCQVTLNSDQTVTASFVALRTLTVQKQGSGQGTVTSSPAGINCGSSCSAQFDQGTQVTLTAKPASGSVFTGWSGGGCSGTGTCQVQLNTDKTVTASFAKLAPPDTEITQAKVSSKRRRASFSFAATGPGPYGFECKLTRQSPALAEYRPCSSPKLYKRLRLGRHVFYVRAKGPGGTDPTPAKKAFRIRRS